jgi:hypothetical protein
VDGNDEELLPTSMLTGILLFGGVLVAGFIAYRYWAKSKASEPKQAGTKVVSVAVELPVKKAAKKK